MKIIFLVFLLVPVFLFSEKFATSGFTDIKKKAIAINEVISIDVLNSKEIKNDNPQVVFVEKKDDKLLIKGLKKGESNIIIYFNDGKTERYRISVAALKEKAQKQQTFKIIFGVQNSLNVIKE